MNTTPMRALFALMLLAAALPAHGQNAPWVAGSLHLATDNQPLPRAGLNFEYGRYLSSDATLSVHAATARADDLVSSSVLAGATLSLPDARLGMRARAGAALEEGSTAFVYDAIANAALGAAASLRARTARERYTRTVSSLTEPVFVTTAEVALDRAAAPGWAGEGVIRRETFGDDNAVRTAWVWLLAPLSRGAGHALRAGLATAWQDADSSTWQPVSFPGGAPSGAELEGRYAPYYTPAEIKTHSVIANVALRTGAVWIITDAAVGVRATEQAPVLHRGTNSYILSFYERSFTPYRVSLAVAAPLDARTALRIDAEHSRTSYYRVGRVTLSLQRSLAR